MAEKRLLLLAGPNGSGKSSTLNKIITSPFYPGIYISPDEAVKMSPFAEIEDIRERYGAAMDFCETIRHELISEGKSFCFETVLSTPGKLDFLRMAKSEGYLIESIFITTSDPEINIRRVARRVQEGGHHVEDDAVIRRYHRSMGLMTDLFELSDNMIIVDSSEDHNEMIIVIKNEFSIVGLHVDRWLPWIRDKIISPIFDNQMNEQQREYYELSERESNIYMGVEKSNTSKGLMRLFL
ncbi:zeta toxin family protein [Paenibacillus sp. LHD-117]|uniref:zeta toxin family protein n=1 Tax=Paenibacillus sp. LHD-117 TaxID=3071412 RepID=UPI0027E1AE63|nr:zeta toxin family protein [Paenibacillus sp. LHD-117]MDQ6420049.1 zeta toxin family protein [Paenibacillus sp. LHD-117]